MCPPFLKVCYEGSSPSGATMSDQNDEVVRRELIDEAIDQFNALDECFWFVTECDSGHVHDIGAFSEEPPEKIICPECGGNLWVNWDATASKFPGGAWTGSLPAQPVREHMGDYWERKKLLEAMGWRSQ